MNAPHRRWVERRLLMLLHDESLAMHGGAAGLREERLLESALARNHAFVDGNKRAAFLAVGLFLGLDGWGLSATQAEATVAVLHLAAGEWDEAAFAAWLRAHLTPR